MSDKRGRAIETQAARIAELELYLVRIRDKITQIRWFKRGEETPAEPSCKP